MAEHAWCHVVAVWAQSAVFLYVNGLPAGQAGSAGFPPAATRSTLQIGRLNGGIADLQLYTRTDVSAADLYGGYEDTGVYRPPPPPAGIASPPPPPSPPPWPPIAADATEGGAYAFGATHAWLPYPLIDYWSMPQSLFRDQGSAHSAAASFSSAVAPPSAYFKGGGWWRQWSNCSLSTAPLFFPTPGTVGMRLRIEGGPPGVPVTLWQFQPAGGLNISVSIGANADAVTLTVGATSSSVACALYTGVKARIEVTSLVSQTAGTVMTTLYVDTGTFHNTASTNVVGRTTNITAASIVMPSAPLAVGRALLTELYVTNRPSPVTFLSSPPPSPPPVSPAPPLPPSPPLPRAPPLPPSPPPPSPPLPPTVATVAINPGAVSHLWLPQPQVSSWGGGSGVLSDTAGNNGPGLVIMPVGSMRSSIGSGALATTGWESLVTGPFDMAIPAVIAIGVSLPRGVNVTLFAVACTDGGSAFQVALSVNVAGLYSLYIQASGAARRHPQ